jgi:hypothetical protein
LTDPYSADELLALRFAFSGARFRSGISSFSDPAASKLMCISVLPIAKR